MLPDEPTDEERREELPEDGDTPFRPADPSREDRLPDDTHPDTDTDVDSQDLYDEGVYGAAGIEEPNAGNAVTGYDPAAEDDKADSPS